MKRKRETTTKLTDLDKWLNACADLLEGMIETAGWNVETKRSLAEVFVNKTDRLLHERARQTIH